VTAKGLLVNKLWREWRGTLGFIALMFVFRSAVADWNYVPSSSMNPTLIAGDRVLVNKLAYSGRVPFTTLHMGRWSAPQRGDVITFDSPTDGVNLIKRVVAVGGDSIAMVDNQLVINGQPALRHLLGQHLVPTETGNLLLEISREHLPGARFEHQVARWTERNVLTDFSDVVVPVDHVLVLGDSRDNSADSRFIGMIDIDRITGRAERVVMSHMPDHFWLPRAQRWWLPLHGQEL
jgi:signal peptidase I